MSASLVGSEMCIRDRCRVLRSFQQSLWPQPPAAPPKGCGGASGRTRGLVGPWEAPERSFWEACAEEGHAE
eukprot:8414872-Alexandrium_andersonii.AAC.1